MQEMIKLPPLLSLTKCLIVIIFVKDIVNCLLKVTGKCERHLNKKDTV
jgi:hypothetical protein